MFSDKNPLNAVEVLYFNKIHLHILAYSVNIAINGVDLHANTNFQ